MVTHVRIVGILHLTLGLVGILGAVCLILVCGGVAGIVHAAGSPDAQVAVPILGVVGGTLGTVILVLALPGTIGGIGVLLFREWGRVLMIVVSVLDLFNLPLGTLVGVYGLWTLLHRDTVPLFQARAPAASPTLAA